VLCGSKALMLDLDLSSKPGKDALPRILNPRYLILQDATEWR
jgi:hypothetical protein